MDLENLKNTGVPNPPEKSAMKTDVELTQLQTRCLALLVKLQGNEPLSPEEQEQKKKLREEIALKLKILRGFLQSPKYRDVFDAYLFKNREKEITPEVFAELSALPAVQKKDQEARDSGGELPLYLVDPNSPWFYVMRRNRTKTLGNLRENLHNNMNSWFEL